MRMRSRSLTGAAMLAPLTISMLASAGAVAQDESAVAPSVEEIVVSATRRGDTNIQDTPIAITALTGDALADMGAHDFEDFFRTVPGISFTNKGVGEQQYIIRGVSGVGAGTVGLYFDDIAVTGSTLSSPIVKLFDMDRIEVLRGPQGTTFGSSSLSGTIRWLPAKAKYDVFEANVGAEVSSTRHSDDLGSVFDGMVNLPLVSDKLALRLSGTIIDGAGYIDNRFQKDANTEKSNALRAMLSWNALENLEVTAMSMFQNVDAGERHYYHKENLDMPFSPTLNGGPLPDEFYSYVQSRGTTEDELELHSLKGAYTQDWGRIEAIATYYNRQSDFRHPTDAAGEVLSGGTHPADSTGRSVLHTTEDREVTSQELRFTSSWQVPLQLVIGGYRQSTDVYSRTTFNQTNPLTGTITADSEIFLDRDGTSTLDELAFYGELTWNITDRFSATAGARHFQFDYEQQARSLAGFFGAPGAGPGPRLTFDESGTIYKGALNFALSDDSMVYASVSEGFRPGGAQDPVRFGGLITVPAGYESDSVVNYEAGFKNSWLSNRLVTRAALFNIDWTNMQTERAIVDPGTGLRTTYLGNAGKALVRGVELEVVAQPTNELSMNVSMSYLTDAQLEESFPLAADGLKGDWMPFVPEFTASAQIGYETDLPLPSAPIGSVRLEYTYTGETHETFRPTELFYREINSYSIVNLRFGLRTGDWDGSLSIENLLDEDETIAYTVDFAGPRPVGGNIPDSLYRPWPRSVVLSLRRSF